MVIYADVLFILNTVTDYFLIKLSGVIANRRAGFARLALAAVIGGFSSFYILIPDVSVFIDIPLKILICSALVLTAFGFKELKQFIRLTVVLFSLTFLLGGIIAAAVFFFRPENVYINNTIPYIDIDPVVFVVSGAGYYIVSVIIKHFTERHSDLARECYVTLMINGLSYHLKGMVDTGNSLVDVFGMSEIIVAEKAITEEILGSLDPCEQERRFRAIPVKTVSGNAVLNGLRLDKAVIRLEKTEKTLKNPIVAASRSEIKDGWDAIINPRSIL